MCVVCMKMKIISGHYNPSFSPFTWFRLYTYRAAALLSPHLTLFEYRHLLLQRDVLLLQLSVVLQQTSLTELVLLDVIT